MALTKPKLSTNINTDSSVFSDPILVLHQGSTLANVDTGFLFNRANGLVNNVAIYWSESTNSFITAFTNSTGAPDANVNVVSYANLRANVTTVESIYTVSGVYWTANGQAWSSGGGAFSQVKVTGGNTIQANAEGISTLTFVGGTGITVTADSVTDTLTFSTISTADSIWTTDHDSGLVTDSVVLSEDNGLVADGITDEYDLGTITITGVITGDTVAVNSMPGDRLITGTDISVGNISAAGALTFTGTGNRITGDFSNGTIANRVTFQTSTANSSTVIAAMPSGTGIASAFRAYSSNDPDNTSIAGMTAVSSLDARFASDRTGTGTYLPMTFYTGGSERVRIDATTGNVVIVPTTTSITATTGALVVAGGVGVAGNINIAQLATITGNVTMSSNVTISRSLGVGTAVAGNVGEIRATNYITAFYSDKRLKSNIEPITSALDKVKQLAGIFYTQNTLAEQYGYCDYGQQVGLFAQDVQQVLPQAVKPAPFDVGPGGTSISGQNYLTIQYEKIVPLLVEAIKELSDKIDQLKG